VYDSVPQSEWDETMHKARALIKARIAILTAADNTNVEKCLFLIIFSPLYLKNKNL
jgi:hypothetical protein